MLSTADWNFEVAAAQNCSSMPACRFKTINMFVFRSNLFEELEVGLIMKLIILKNITTLSLNYSHLQIIIPKPLPKPNQIIVSIV